MWDCEGLRKKMVRVEPGDNGRDGAFVHQNAGVVNAIGDGYKQPLSTRPAQHQGLEELSTGTVFEAVMPDRLMRLFGVEGGKAWHKAGPDDVS